MTSLLTALVIGLAVPLVAIACTKVFVRAIRNSEKPMIVNFADGTTQVVAVPAKADQLEVSTAVRDELDLQDRVLRALEAHRERVSGLEIARGRHGDCIVKYGGKSLAVVVKTRVGRTLLDEIGRYRSGELGAQKLALFMIGEVPPRLIRQIKTLDDPRAVELVQLGDIDALESELQKVLNQEFRRDTAAVSR